MPWGAQSSYPPTGSPRESCCSMRARRTARPAGLVQHGRGGGCEDEALDKPAPEPVALLEDLVPHALDLVVAPLEEAIQRCRLGIPGTIDAGAALHDGTPAGGRVPGTSGKHEHSMRQAAGGTGPNRRGRGHRPRASKTKRGLDAAKATIRRAWRAATRGAPPRRAAPRDRKGVWRQGTK